MRKMFLILAILFGSFGVASAQIHDDTYHGKWKSFSGTMSSGAYTCGISTSWPTQTLAVKWISDEDGLSMYLADTGWNISSNAAPKFAFRFDDYAMWTGQGFGTNYSTTFGLHIAYNQTIDFLSQFSAADTLEFSYTTARGTNTWRADLNGSDAVVADLTACVARVKRMLGD